MMAGMLQDQNLEKEIERQMGGCITGFFNIFDRHHSHSHSLAPKRLPPPSFRDEPDRTAGTTPARSGSRTPAAEPGTPSEASVSASSPRSPLPFRTLEFKECTRSPWKFCKEAPRLSLDSRAVTGSNGSLYPREIRGGEAPVLLSPDDGDHRQRRSPSVIARLMGLENLPRANPQPANNAELRRSASESRVSKDLYQFIEGNHFQQQPNVTSNGMMIREGRVPGDVESSTAWSTVGAEDRQQVRVPQQRGGAGQGGPRSFYNSADFFPEPKKRSASVYEEIERRLRMRGVDEPSKDLETLKQILDALQLKGLLHAKRPTGNNAGRQRSFVYENVFEHHSPIVLMKPSRSSGRTESKSPPSSFRSMVRRTSPSPAGESSPTRWDSSSKSPGRRRPVVSPEQKRVSPVQSPRFDPCRTRSSQPMNNRTMSRTQKQAVEFYPAEDESSTLSESSISTPSPADTERTKPEEYKEGRSLLERCDKLLHSIAEMTGTAESSQPSPVSVLDSAASFYKDESSPSPVKKRSIDFIKDGSGELEDDDLWSVVTEKGNPEDADLAYVSDIVRALSYLPEDSNAFLLLEKQQHLKGKDASRASRMHRKLIFDTVTEILERKRQLPQWSTVPSSQPKPLVQQIWTEFRLIRERDASEEDLLEVICGVLRKDLIMGDAANGWGMCPVEVSESVLDVERLIFKDMIGEAIGDLVKVQMPRRRLVF